MGAALVASFSKADKGNAVVDADIIVFINKILMYKMSPLKSSKGRVVWWHFTSSNRHIPKLRNGHSNIFPPFSLGPVVRVLWSCSWVKSCSLECRIIVVCLSASRRVIELLRLTERM